MNLRAKVIIKFLIYIVLGSFLGTTKRGIGPTYAFKAFRSSIRVGELKNWDLFLNRYNAINQLFKEHYGISVDKEKELKTLKEHRDRVVGNNMIIDSATYFNKSIKEGKRVLLEGSIL